MRKIVIRVLSVIIELLYNHEKVGKYSLIDIVAVDEIAEIKHSPNKAHLFL
jgi:hypothetical protein